MLLISKETIQKIGRLESLIYFFLCRLLDELFVFYKACLFQPHRLRVGKKGEAFSILVQNEHLAIERTKARRLFMVTRIKIKSKKLVLYKREKRSNTIQVHSSRRKQNQMTKTFNTFYHLQHHSSEFFGRLTIRSFRCFLPTAF